MLTDIEIADQAQLTPINEIAAQLGLDEDAIEQYGKYKAKINLPVQATPEKKHKLVLVTSINPTPAGEGSRPSWWAWGTPCPYCTIKPSSPCANLRWGQSLA